MNTLQVFVVKDRALNCFMQPFFAPSKGVAIRSFGDAINDPQHDMNKHPDDYDLWYIGTFDTEKGFFDQNHGSHDGKFDIEQIAVGKNMIRHRETINGAQQR